MQDMLGSFTDPSLMNDLSNDLIPLGLSLDNFTQSDIQQQDNSTSPTRQDLNFQISEEEAGESQNVDSDTQMTGVGAGPLPTGFGVHLPPSVGSTLTEFTKRRNWSQQVVEELKDFLHILTPDGRLMYVSPSTKALTGYDGSELVGKFITSFIHQDDTGMFLREFHESIASGNPLRFFYRFRKQDGSYMIFESQGHPHFSSEHASSFTSGGSQGVSFCRGFFMMARPYPTKNASLLDSFLEHKIENERLKKRIADLKREEHEDIQETRRQVSGNSGDGAFNNDRIGGVTGEAAAVPVSPSQYDGMPPPAKPSISTTALTSHNLSEALASSTPDSINDKMARYEGLPSHLDTIEMLTGLRYREGERSKGISTGAESPNLVRGDQGIDIPVDSDGRPVHGNNSPLNTGESGSFGGEEREVDKRRRTTKVADEYVCTDCGTLDSPEWRRGPQGPKTLCNACGLRWAKKEKKQSKQQMFAHGSSMKSGNGTSGGGGGMPGHDNGSSGNIGVAPGQGNPNFSAPSPTNMTPGNLTPIPGNLPHPGAGPPPNAAAAAAAAAAVGMSPSNGAFPPAPPNPMVATSPVGPNHPQSPFPPQFMPGNPMSAGSGPGPPLGQPPPPPPPPI